MTGNKILKIRYQTLWNNNWHKDYQKWNSPLSLPKGKEHLVVVALFACFGIHNSYFLSKIAKESSVEGSWGDHDQFRQK